VWAELGPEPVGASVADLLTQVVIAPDGCTLDAEGHIWCADGFGSRVVRIAPGGAIVDEITGPGGMGVYACALGGDDGRTLLMCCAPDFYAHTRAPVREAVLVTTGVTVPHAGRP
jgi:sugar lactone lactonase YvrE